MFSKGVQYMLLSTLFFALMNVCIKLVPHIPAIEIIFFRSVISVVMSYLVLRRQQVNIWGTNKGLLITRGITGAIALVLYFTTLQNIPLATAVTIQYLSPIFTTILGIFIVKEKVKPWQWIFFLVSFIGILVIEGVDVRISPFYLTIGVAGAAISGISYNIIRKLNTREHPLVIVFYFPMVALPFSGIYSLFDWVQPMGWDWAILLLVGVFTQLAQYYMTMSYQTEELSKVAHLNYIGIFYALLLGFIMFDETFTIGSYVGMALVLVGVILNIRYKSKLAKTAELEAVSK
ncbi:DMT family transporter [Pontibacter sp. BT310]|uniref:DMT family transporter n=1 Tax=Pontibacter populi TaxID=890055 RepID=A0ABS6XGF6_9BACT|nr:MULTISPECIES: DMT family transporter [Pontibacter]MBJ6120154.1 DMT family transporter [Pontibacter sp. BT310]MBR0572587.1 DMT family transporter [Microvirga sp. STS03]MBW3367007.1 DMT family transporter [Pontibacter populi]